MTTNDHSTESPYPGDQGGTAGEAAPPATPEPKPTQPARAARRGAWVAVVTTVVGALVVLGTLGAAVASSLSPYAYVSRGDQGAFVGPGGNAENLPEQVSTQAADGVTAIDVQANITSIDVSYGDVPEATLTQRGGIVGEQWTLAREGDELRLVAPAGRDQGQGWGWNDEDFAYLSLVLPASLEQDAPALDLEVGAGSVTVAGEFGDTVLDVAAGQLDFRGAAASLAATVAAGQLTVDATVPGAISIDVAMGEFVGTFGGATQPPSIDVSVATGNAVLAVPQGAYRLAGDVSAGDRTIQVEQSPTAASTLTVNVEAGDATVSYAGG